MRHDITKYVGLRGKDITSNGAVILFYSIDFVETFKNHRQECHENRQKCIVLGVHCLYQQQSSYTDRPSVTPTSCHGLLLNPRPQKLSN